MRNLSGILSVMIAAWLCAYTPALGDDGDAIAMKEYQVKAAYLYNFIKFVEWPGNKALSQTHEANICIAGDNPFGSAINLFKQASSPQLALNVKLNVAEGDVPSCHLLFIPQSNSEHAQSLLANAQSHSVLTVSEIQGFANNGGIIEMVKTEENIGLFLKNKINLRINVKRAMAEGLRIDAQLLQIAAEVIQ